MKKAVLICLIIFLTACSTDKGNINPIEILETATPSLEQSAPKSLDTNNGISTQPSPSVNLENSDQPFPSDISEHIYLSDFFQGINGCAVIYDTNNDKYLIHNPELAEIQSSPCSTFKIIATIIGLQSDVLQSEETEFLWNKTQYPFTEWNRDLSLKQAFQASCVWYFRKVIDESGHEMVRKVLADISYGNEDISEWQGSGHSSDISELNGFWLESSLLISPKEQVEVMKKIFIEDSDYKEYIPILKDIMLQDTSSGNVSIYGKTGTGYVNGSCVDAWFVGFAEKDQNTYYFAIRLDDPEKPGVSGKMAKEIIINIFNDSELF